jgi:hemoglobin
MISNNNPYLRGPKDDVYVPLSGPPQVSVPSPEIYAAMGKDNIFRMCEDFYRSLEGTEIRPMFPENMQEASQKLASFLVFRLGGPPLYQQHYGPPRLRERHLPFRINEKSRETWLSIFQKTLVDADKKYAFPKEHMAGFWRFLEEFSGWMVNAK